MPFDYQGAKESGYSDSEIADYLGQQQKFDTAGARKSGYTDSEILAHLNESTQDKFGEHLKRTGERFLSGAESGARNILWNMPVGGAATLAGTATGLLAGQGFQDAYEGARKNTEKITIDPLLDRLTGHDYGKQFGEMVGEGYDWARNKSGEVNEAGERIKQYLLGQPDEKKLANARSEGELFADIMGTAVGGKIGFKKGAKPMSPEDRADGLAHIEMLKKQQEAANMGLVPKEEPTPAVPQQQDLALVPKNTPTFDAPVPEAASGLLPKAPDWTLEGDEPRPQEAPPVDQPLPELNADNWDHLPNEDVYQAARQRLDTQDRPLPDINPDVDMAAKGDPGVPLHGELGGIEKVQTLQDRSDQAMFGDAGTGRALPGGELLSMEGHEAAQDRITRQITESQPREDIPFQNFEQLPERVKKDREVQRLQRELEVQDDLLTRHEEYAQNERLGEPTRQNNLQKKFNKLSYEEVPGETPKDVGESIREVKQKITDLKAELTDRLEKKHGIGKDFWETTSPFPGEAPHIQKPFYGGPGGKQRGAISLFKNDPDFEAFKKTLPPKLRPHAEEMYKLYKESQDPAVKQTGGDQARDAIREIPGVKEVVEKVADIEGPWSEVRKDAVLDKDIPKGIFEGMKQRLYSGGRMYGFAKDNTAVRYGVQQWNNAFNRANAWIGEKLLNKENGLKPSLDKLESKEQALLWANMLRVEGKGALTDAQLRTLGLSEKSIEAHNKYRELTKETFADLNAERVRRGMKPLPERLSYIPSRFLGDFIFKVSDANDTLIHLVGTKTKWSAAKVLKEMQAKHPDLVFGEVEHRPLYRALDKQSVFNGYQQMLEILAKDDPRVAALENTFGEWAEKEGYNAYGFKRHFLNKRIEPVKGFEGNKEWKSAEDNAKEGFQASLTYLEMARKWLEAQKATEVTKEMFKDKDFNNIQPNALRYLKLYENYATGKLEMAGKFIDSVANGIAGQMGWGGTTQTNAVRFVKKWMTLKFLGFFNIPFAGSQFIQPMQVVPGWLQYLNSRGAAGHSVSAWAKASVDIASMFSRDKMGTNIGKTALEWAQTNHRMDPHILDDIRNATDTHLGHNFERVAALSVTFPEKYSRLTAYMTFVHFLDESGLKGERAYQTAANLTDLSMTDYSLHERPLVYKQLGLLGEMMSSLSTYKHNQFSQLGAFSGHSKQALGTMVGISVLMAGLMGFYGREDADALITQWNKLAASQGWDNRVPTTGEYMLKATKDQTFADNFIGFGAVSALSGMDMSSKLSNAQITPDMGVQMIFPFAQDMGKTVGSFFEMLAQHDAQSVKKFAYTAAPNSMKGLAELAMTDNGAVQNPNTGETDFLRGDVKANTDWVSRLMGGRSLKESRERQATYDLKTQEVFNKNLMNKIIDQAKRTKNPETIARLQKQYIQKGGDAGAFTMHIIQNEMNKHQSAFERAQGIPNGPAGVRRYQEGEEYKKK